jgi:methionine-rich copper-binding protein CopC
MPLTANPRPSQRRGLAVLVGVVLVAGSVLGLASPAFAHNYLVSSTPSSGQTLTKLPSRFVITTNEGLLDLSGHGSGFAFRVQDSKGLYYGNGCVKVTGPSMSIAAALGAPGKYSVVWQIVSADGHIVSNQYNFTWAPAKSVTPTKGTASPQNCGGKSGGAAPADPNLGKNTTATPNANLGIVLGVGGGILGLGIVLTVVLLVVGRKKKPRAE